MGSNQYWFRQLAEGAGFDADLPVRQWTQGERHALLHGDDGRLGRSLPRDFEGVAERFERIYLGTADNLSERKRSVIGQFTRSEVCSDCDGERLAASARTATVAGCTLPELARWEVSEVADFASQLDDSRVAPAVSALSDRLRALVTVGLGYLSLERSTTTLSGGESQRVKLVRHLGSSLTSMTYVVDEPTVGLHASDVERVIRLLRQIRDRGKSVLVVEHDPMVMAAADQVIEIGPAAGPDGGHLTFQGSYAALLQSNTCTGRALKAEPLAKAHESRSAPVSMLRIKHARANNLRDVTVDIPSGRMTVVTGVAGSGKSSLMGEFVAQHESVVADQRPVSATRRSSPMTYTGVATAIRRLFATANGVPVKMFSANSDGGCPECSGAGVIYTDLAFMEGQRTTCPECQGKRFRAEVLQHRVGGLSISDIEELPVAEALRCLPEPTVAQAMQPLVDVGLGYLRLGQPLSTLSGGECQRVKITRELRRASDATTYVLDEPTTGLHPQDIAGLLEVFDRLIDHGSTVVVIEHNGDVIRHADWMIELGPGPGRHGGKVLFEGLPMARPSG
ncbi:ATP-binding cassette domain-containing protein [Demetria terragena]|uniref:ATP-binding cassette domain-containing protein n=1 Tax=Demetria terragena TaxID=63959 RepID=UPI001B7F8DE3|nr:ATP-binding cassette domain-containing protein [Demetria terragena]